MRSKLLCIVLVVFFGLCFSEYTIAGELNENSESLKQAQIVRFIKLLQSQSNSDKVNSSEHLAMAGQPVHTQVAGNGGIAGTVYGLDEDAMGRAFVKAFPADSIPSGGELSKGFAVVNGDGTYQIDGLAAGNYYVAAWADGYVFKFYDNALDISEAIEVKVSEGAVTQDIDFNMEKLVPGTGIISGLVVSEKDSLPVVGAIVTTFSPDNPMLFGWAETDSTGSYRITELKSGFYYVTIWADGYIPEMYDNAATFEEATLVEVVEPNETTGINFALSTGGSISGLVTDDNGTPIVGAHVVTMREDSTIVGGGDDDPTFIMGGYGKAITDENGQYTIVGLPAGSYLVCAEVWSNWTYVVEWYDNATSPEEATLVPVQADEEVTGIDFQLSIVVPAGVIAGRVTDLQGNPISDAFVQVQSADDFSTCPGVWAYAITDEDGNYRVVNLPNGSYLVSACAQSGWQYICRWWPDAESPDEATPVVVKDENAPGPIDFKLPITMGTASIAGTVLSNDGQALAGAGIQISPVEPVDPANPSGNVINAIWAFGYTDSSGSYQIDRLPAGDYIAYASYWENDSFDRQRYDHADSLADATSIVLSDGETRSDIDFTLTVRPIYGSITGTVVDSITGLPVDRAYIEISPAFWDYDMSMRPCCWSYYTITDENGTYQLERLWEGEYLISVYANGAFEYFKNVVVAEQATPVQVTGGSTSEVNFALTTRNDGSGIISGIVVSEWEEMPLEIAVVTARPAETTPGWSQSEMLYTAVTDIDGSYEMKGLPPGEYYVMSFAPWAIGEYYDNVYDPSQATPAKVDGINPTIGIDFSLSQMWFLDFNDGREGALNSARIVGKVTDSNGQPLSGATVYALNEAGQPISFVRTKADGTFELSGIPPGKYVLQAGEIGYSSQFNGNAESFSQAVPLQVGSGTIEVNFSLTPQSSTGVKDRVTSLLPESVELYGNYPNPFNPETRISFSLPQAMQVKLCIFNIYGEQVAQLHDGTMNAGTHNLIWDGRNQLGQPVTSGLYIYRLESEGATLTGKMILMR